MDGSSSRENLSTDAGEEEAGGVGGAGKEEEPAVVGRDKGKERIGGGRAQDGVQMLVPEGDEIDETNSSILIFLRTFPRVLLRAVRSKHVFAKRSHGSGLKSTCTLTDVINDHKGGKEVLTAAFPLLPPALHSPPPLN